MRRFILVVLAILTSCALARGQASRGQPRRGRPADGTYRMLKLEFEDLTSLKLTDNIRSMPSAALRNAGERLLQLAGEPQAPEVNPLVRQAADRTMEISISASGPDAQKKLDRATEAFQSLVRSKPAPEEAKQRLATIAPELERVQGLCSIFNDFYTKRQALWPDMLGSRIKEDELNIRRFEMDLLSKETRAKALRDQIKRINVEVDDRVSADPILVELKKVVDLRKRSLARAEELVKQKSISSSELEKEQEQLLEAQIRVQERTESLRQRAGGDVLGRLSGELATVMIDIAELSAKLSYLSANGLQVDIHRIDEAKLKRLQEDFRHFFPQDYPPLGRQLEEQRDKLVAEILRLTLTKVEVVPTEK